MPDEPTIEPTVKSPRRGAWVEVNPAFARALAARGLDTPAAFLDLPGEVVCGHPDRHVLRVELSGFQTAFYLKRQHTITRRERFRNWRAGFGWVSRSEREAATLQQLAAAELPGPRWVAVGDDACGRAFLMVEEVAGAVDLRAALMDSGRSAADRALLAERIGHLVGRLHDSGFTTPDLTAKHLLVSRDSGAIVPIDWQTAERVASISTTEQVRALAALHASVADHLATPRERFRVLRAALHAGDSARGQFSRLARRIDREAARRAERRSIRDQRDGLTGKQRLIWLAEEAVCAVPDVAATWPTPAITAPFYGSEPGTLSIEIPDGRAAHLIRGRSFTPIGRFRGWIRGTPWRSPGATLGRLLFHLERYGVPAPRLLAFGQRLTGSASAEWFALHTPPAPPIVELTPASAEQLGRCIRLLHDAGCRPGDQPLAVFGQRRGVSIRDVTALRLVKRVGNRDRAADLDRLRSRMDWGLWSAVQTGYAARAECEHRTENRLQPAGASR